MQNVDFASYADDNTIYDAAGNINVVTFSLQESSKKIIKWFADNQMKTNEDKCHLIANTNELTDIQIGDYSVKNSGSEKLFGVNIGSKLNFACHVNHLCNKANKKSRALIRVTPYMTLEKKKIVMNSFFNAQFNYCPFIWILHSRKIITKSNVYMNDGCD